MGGGVPALVRGVAACAPRARRTAVWPRCPRAPSRRRPLPWFLGMCGLRGPPPSRFFTPASVCIPTRWLRPAAGVRAGGRAARGPARARAGGARGARKGHARVGHVVARPTDGQQPKRSGRWPDLRGQAIQMLEARHLTALWANLRLAYLVSFPRAGARHRGAQRQPPGSTIRHAGGGRARAAFSRGRARRTRNWCRDCLAVPERLTPRVRRHRYTEGHCHAAVHSPEVPRFASVLLLCRHGLRLRRGSDTVNTPRPEPRRSLFADRFGCRHRHRGHQRPARDGHYTGWLYSTTAADNKGEQFDTSIGRGRSPLGGGGVIAGWERGNPGHADGPHRKLVIPPELAYGSAGRPPTIPGNSTLIFEIELLNCSSARYDAPRGIGGCSRSPRRLTPASSKVSPAALRLYITQVCVPPRPATAMPSG